MRRAHLKAGCVSSYTFLKYPDRRVQGCTRQRSRAKDGTSERYRPAEVSIWKVLETALRFSGVRSYIRATRPVYYVVRSPTYV